MVEQFNGWHFLLWGVTLGVVALLCLIFGVFLRKKSKWYSRVAIIVLLVAGLVLHFLRFWFPPPGETYPYSIRFILPVSICAVNTLIFPFIFMSKSKVLKDYMVYLGILGGFLFLITPYDIINRGLDAGSWEAIRYFASHGVLCAAGFLMVICGHHKLSWRRSWQPVFVLAGVMCMIFATEVILTATGVNGQTFAEMLDPETNNTAMVFGPPSTSGIYASFFDALVPEFFKVAPFDTGYGIMKGDPLYWPIIWLLIPGFIYVTVACFIISLIFNFKLFYRDMKYLFTRKKTPQKFSKIKAS